MVKIGVIFMSFSNPTGHFRDTADFTLSTYSTYGKVSCISEIFLVGDMASLHEC